MKLVSFPAPVWEEEHVSVSAALIEREVIFSLSVFLVFFFVSYTSFFYYYYSQPFGLLCRRVSIRSVCILDG